MDGQRLYHILFAVLTAGILICILWIGSMLLQAAPRVQAFTNATLVWEGLSHVRI